MGITSKTRATPAAPARLGEPLVSRKVQDGNAVRPLGRWVQRLNQGWSFRRCERGTGTDAVPVLQLGEWESVNVPHTVRLEPLNASGGRNFQGVCWYGKQLTPDPAWHDRIIYLHFDGAMQVCDVWLNGQHIGKHYGGYTPFVFDVTHHLHLDGDNVLMLRLDNRDDPDVPPGKPQAELDFVYFGGLYRNVRLEAVDPLHISDPIFADRTSGGGIVVTYPRVSKELATIAVRTDVRNTDAIQRQCRIRHELHDADGLIVAEVSSSSIIVEPNDESTVTVSVDVTEPQLWHPYHPHLYMLHTAILNNDGNAIDAVSTTLGIRRIDFTPADGLAINGEKFVSLGANRHQDHPYLGYAMSDAAQWRDAAKLRAAGFTSVRSHYPQSPAFMDACDALGMLTIVSNPGWQFVGGETFRQRAVQNARLIVRRDRNHPSVILWEAALNESENQPLGAALQQAVHEEYPGDQCFTAGDHEPGFSYKNVPGWDVEYWHNDGSKPYWIREWGDAVDNWSDQQSANRVARGWGEVPMLTQARTHLARMDELWIGHHGTSSGLDGCRLAGACLWAAIDCQRGYHHQPFLGGVMDAMRLPKFNYYLFQSQRSPSLQLDGVQLDGGRSKNLDSGPMVFIANFATFLSPTAVTVFSNCEQVRLLHGEREIEIRSPDAGHLVPHPPFTFQLKAFGEELSTMYMTGVASVNVSPAAVRAEGIIGGRVVATHTVCPPGVVKKIVLEVDTAGQALQADGADFVRIYAKLCDARGTVCPFAEDEVHFELTGAGKIIDGPGLRANPICAEAGIATALVQSTTHAGSLTIRVTAFGLEPGEITFESIAPEAASTRTAAK